MKKFDTLYKRAKSGAVQYWEVFTMKNDEGDAWVCKRSGQLGTKKPLEHQELIKGKNIGKSNETSPVQQATLQAESDWLRKHDEGYKTYAEVMVAMTGGELHGYTGVTDVNVIKEDLERALPEFNTDSAGFIKPMKAPTANWKQGAKKNKYPRYMEPKLDGWRCLIDIDGTSIRLLSSSGKPCDTLEHIRLAIVRGMAKGAFRNHPKITLDGEIYLHGLHLNEISKLIKKKREGTEQLQFWCFDIASHPGTQQERSAEMLKLVAEISEPDQICFTVHYEVNSDEDVLKLHDQWVEKEFEGGMLKMPDGTYQPGQRSSYWEKVKMFEDNEYAFKNFEFGQRGVEDLIAVCWIEVNGVMEEFRAKMNGTLAMKEELYARQDLEGKSLTVKHFGFTKYGIPNLPKGKAFRELD